jgi:hypothetical protein
VFNELALAAETLLLHGFDQDALSRVSSMMPGLPDWLNAKYLDYGGEREPWQEEVASTFLSCQEAALDLRTIGKLT